MKNLFFISLLLLAGCSTSKTADTNPLLGRWHMDKVIMDQTNDVTSEHNPEGNRYIEFKADKTFKSGGDPHGENTGKWSLDQSTGELHIDSAVGEDDDSYWIISIENNQMKWQGTKGDFNRRFTIHHRR